MAPSVSDATARVHLVLGSTIAIVQELLEDQIVGLQVDCGGVTPVPQVCVRENSYCAGASLSSGNSKVLDVEQTQEQFGVVPERPHSEKDRRQLRGHPVRGTFSFSQQGLGEEDSALPSHRCTATPTSRQRRSCACAM